MEHATIALVGSTTECCRKLQQVLRDKGISIQPFKNHDVPLQNIIEIDPELILLDCRKQDIQDLTLCRELKIVYEGPLVLLARPHQEHFILLALHLGADLSLTPDKSLLILAENIRSLTHRLSSTPVFELEFGNLKIDIRKREVTLSNRRINLSTIEFQLFWLLTRKAGQILSREKIHKHLYHTTYNGYDRSIDLYVSRIRQKIGDDPHTPNYLKTIRGVGYQFVAVAGEATNP